jgi:hypothetical protein
MAEDLCSRKKDLRQESEDRFPFAEDLGKLKKGPLPAPRGPWSLEKGPWHVGEGPGEMAKVLCRRSKDLCPVEKGLLLGSEGPGLEVDGTSPASPERGRKLVEVQVESKRLSEKESGPFEVAVVRPQLLKALRRDFV